MALKQCHILRQGIKFNNNLNYNKFYSRKNCTLHEKYGFAERSKILVE